MIATFPLSEYLACRIKGRLNGYLSKTEKSNQIGKSHRR